MSRLLPMSNELVSSLFHLFNQLAATKSKHITFDRAEFAQLLDSGIVVMGSADFDVAAISSPADISTKIREELANNVLADIDLRTGKKAACVFVASHEILDSFGKEYFAAGFTALNRIVGSGHPKAPTSSCIAGFTQNLWRAYSATRWLPTLLRPRRNYRPWRGCLPRQHRQQGI